jgi:hypothetical protein
LRPRLLGPTLGLCVCMAHLSMPYSSAPQVLTMTPVKVKSKTEVAGQDGWIDVKNFMVSGVRANTPSSVHGPRQRICVTPAAHHLYQVTGPHVDACLHVPSLTFRCSSRCSPPCGRTARPTSSSRSSAPASTWCVGGYVAMGGRVPHPVIMGGDVSRVARLQRCPRTAINAPHLAERWTLAGNGPSGQDRVGGAMRLAPVPLHAGDQEALGVGGCPMRRPQGAAPFFAVCTLGRR